MCVCTLMNPGTAANARPSTISAPDRDAPGPTCTNRPFSIRRSPLTTRRAASCVTSRASVMTRGAGVPDAVTTRASGPRE